MLLHIRRISSLSTLTSVFLWAILLFFLFLIGAFTALAPELVVRLTPLLMVPVFFAVAAFSENKCDLSTRFVLNWLLIVLAILSLWPTYLILKIGSMPSIDGRRMIVLLSIFSLAYLVINRPILRKHFFGDSDPMTQLVSMLILGYIGLRYISLGDASYPFYSFIVVTWDLVNYFSMYFLAISFLHHKKTSERFIAVMLWITLLIGCFVVLEKLQGVNYLSAYAPRGGNLEAQAMMQSISRDRDGAFRAQGTFEHPIALAEYCAMGMCFFLASLLWNDGAKNRLIYLCAFIVSAGLIFASGSRSGLVCAGVGALLVFLLWAYRANSTLNSTGSFTRKFLFLTTLVGILALAAPIILTLTQGRSTAERMSTLARSEMLVRGLPSIADNPFFGVGVGSAGQIAGHIGNGGIITLDNHYLGIAIESGVPATIVFILTLLIPALKASHVVISRAGPHSCFLAGAVGALSVLLIIRGTMWLSTNLTLGYLIAGIVMILSRIPAEGKLIPEAGQARDRTVAVT
jgi:O-antigen ligase